MSLADYYWNNFMWSRVYQVTNIVWHRATAFQNWNIFQTFLSKGLQISERQICLNSRCLPLTYPFCIIPLILILPRADSLVYPGATQVPILAWDQSQSELFAVFTLCLLSHNLQPWYWWIWTVQLGRVFFHKIIFGLILRGQKKNNRKEKMTGCKWLLGLNLSRPTVLGHGANAFLGYLQRFFI